MIECLDRSEQFRSHSILYRIKLSVLYCVYTWVSNDFLVLQNFVTFSILILVSILCISLLNKPEMRSIYHKINYKNLIKIY